ncbi:hypothetical protein RHMOL_Rhmol05G0005000 [Rhododendron molle]|uniref:Uncharacterized protein n=1 Tax=Rhododendron molle TaxID=49168 RepID=A0ACC0NKB0_RHOML|nr:hypothetical protein RHMOL_Rhmol05G0005000 [Rhododendron molle]
MSESDVVSWRALFSGYVRLGYGSEAREVFEDTENKGIERNGMIGGFNQSGCYSESVFYISKDASARFKA